MRAIRLITVVALALVMLTSSGGGAAWAVPAGQGKVDMVATGGFGAEGSYLLGEWFPVRVSLNNPAGGGARRVRVEVASIGSNGSDALITYAREVDLPGQSRKEVTLYAYTSTFTRELEVYAREGNAVVGSVKLSLSPLEQRSNLLVGVLSSDPSFLNALGGEGLGHTEFPPQSYSYSGAPVPSSARATVAHLGAGDIPGFSYALDSLDVIALDDVDTSGWSAAQRDAVAAWVGRGGMLVGFGRPGGGAALAAVSDLLPVTLGEPRQLGGLSSLGALVSTPITPTGQVLAPAVTLRTGKDVDARVMAQDGGVPLVAMRNLGNGHVAYVVLSPAVSPLKGWDGTVPLLKRIVAEHPVRVSLGATQRTGDSYSYSYSPYGGMFDIPGLDLPSAGLVGLFLLVYIFVIGPINFIILRRMGRGELAWLTVPALVLLFSLGAYFIGFGAKGGELLAVRSNVVQTVPGLPQASVSHFFGIFSPQRGTYSLEVPGDSAISEVSTSGYYEPRSDNAALVMGNGETGPTRLSGVNINTWSLRAFMSEGTVPAESPLEADLQLGDNVIEGTVRNRSQSQVENVALIRGDEQQLIGALAPGQDAKVQLKVSYRPMTNLPVNNLLQVPLNVGSYSPGYPPYGGRSVSDAERRYNRQLELLSKGLGGMVSSIAPTDMSVVALAWGPGAPSGFSVSGRSPRQEEQNLWTARLSVRGDGAASPKLGSGSVPFFVYDPDSSPSWLADDESGTTSFLLDPYADLAVRLPIGTRPGSLRLEYSSSLSSKVTAQAYNVATGNWDNLGELAPPPGTGPSTPNLDIPNPAAYTGPSGDVTIRLLSESGVESLTFSSINFTLNK